VSAIEEQLLAAVGELRGIEAANRLCEVCVTALGVQAAAISVVHRGNNVATLGASSAAARAYDEVQFTTGEGPCLDSVARRAPVVVIDLADPTEARWPLYRPAMLAHQIRGIYALPVMVAGECVGALDLFLDSAGHLDSERLAAAQLAADLAQMPLRDLLDDELQSAATTPDAAHGIGIHIIARIEVAQATGMLMAQLSIGPTEALLLLRAHAYATNTDATQVAREIIDRRLRFDQP
jgi:transcriptional regulator with GAF, ATPase, and Fis domain